MINRFYDKPKWRKENFVFLKSCFGKQLPGTYVELIGGCDPKDKKGQKEMLYILTSMGMIQEQKQFVGVDIDPVVPLQRKRECPKSNTYPLVFGDVFSCVKKIQLCNGFITDVFDKQKLEVNPHIVAINFDVGRKAVRDPNKDNEWWTSNAGDIRSIVMNAWKYTDRLAIIGNFCRGRGTEKGNRKKFLIDAIGKTFYKTELQGTEVDIIKSFQDYSYNGSAMVTVRFLIKRGARNITIHFFNKAGEMA